uniref:Uncharacterized protein n=1 Tax=Siphoviridae sp. ctEqU3 TaxID=2825399 RepID=A0A8S5P2G7_9CAUD|nr:MAG TPA: hypothetical protein [Siphoviridae sp. ctEqU3]
MLGFDFLVCGYIINYNFLNCKCNIGNYIFL